VIRVLIADDHTIVRHGLRQILSSEQDMAVSAEAQNGQEVLDIVRREHVDIVVLDISMPGRNGLETLKELKRHHPGIAVIVLSMHPKDQYAVRVIKAGASGYITKESAPSELVVAIRKACRGEKYIDPEIAEVLANYIEHGRSPRCWQTTSNTAEQKILTLDYPIVSMRSSVTLHQARG